MPFDHVEISKGPDKWFLAESLFHDDEEPEEPVHLRFTGKSGDEEIQLSVSVDSITRVRNEPGMYRVKGIASIYSPKMRVRTAEHVPVEVNFSTRTRKGIAQIQF